MGDVLDHTDILDVSGSALSTEAVLIDVEQFGQLEVSIQRPTAFAVSRMLRALEALGADMIANELAEIEDRDAVRSSVRLHIDSAHTSTLKFKLSFKIERDQAPRLKRKGANTWKGYLAGALVSLLLAEGYAVLKKEFTDLPPPATCQPQIVERAGRTLENAAREAQDISLVANTPRNQPMEVRINVEPLGMPPEQRRRS